MIAPLPRHLSLAMANGPLPTRSDDELMALAAADLSEAYGVLVAEYQHESASAPSPVYGVGDADLTRMSNYLNAMAAQGRYRYRPAPANRPSTLFEKS